MSDYAILNYRPKTWEDAAAWTLDTNELSPPSTWRHADVMSFRQLYEAANWGGLANKAWHELANVGIVWSDTDMVDLLSRKQRDYGQENILKFGTKGVLIRLWDKIARYENICAKPAGSQNFESATDTLMDMIGYVVLYKMICNGTFELPLEEQ